MIPNNRLKQGVAVSLVLMAIFLLLLVLTTLAPLATELPDLVDNPSESDIAMCWGCVLAYAPLAVFAGILLLFREKIAERLCRAMDTSPVAWEVAVFRVVVFSAGIAILSKSLPALADIPRQLVDLLDNEPAPGLEPLLWDTLWNHGVYVIVQLALAIYLLAGAPGLLRWHFRQIEREPSLDQQDATASHDSPDFASEQAAAPASLSNSAILPWTRLGLVAMGAVAFHFSVEHFNSSVRVLEFACRSGGAKMFFQTVMIFVVGFLALFGAACVLIRYSDALARKIAAGPSETEPAWDRTACRIALLGVGILLVGYGLPRLASLLSNAALFARHAPGSVDPQFLPSKGMWWYCILPSAQVALGIFLAWSAPWFLKPAASAARTGCDVGADA